MLCNGIGPCVDNVDNNGNSIVDGCECNPRCPCNQTCNQGTCVNNPLIQMCQSGFCHMTGSCPENPECAGKDCDLCIGTCDVNAQGIGVCTITSNNQRCPDGRCISKDESCSPIT